MQASSFPHLSPHGSYPKRKSPPLRGVLTCDFEESDKRAVSSRGVYNIALCSSFLVSFNFQHITTQLFTVFTVFLSTIIHSSTITMLFSILICTMGLVLPGGHSLPATSESFSVSEMANLARALPSGDTYPPQPPGGGPGKRGLIYNSGTLIQWSDLFVDVDTPTPYVTYGSNGGVDRGNGLNARFSYVPTLQVNGELQNSEWDDLVPILIEGGTKALLA